MILHNYVQ